MPAPEPSTDANAEITFSLSLLRLVTQPHSAADAPASSQIEKLSQQIPPDRMPAGRTR